MRHLSLRAKLLLAFALLNILACSAYTWMDIMGARASVKQTVDARLSAVAAALPYTLGEAWMDRAHAAGGSVDDKAYLAMIRRLYALAHDSGIKYVYLMVVQDGKVLTVTDSSEDSDIAIGKYQTYMAEYQDASPAVQLAWETDKPQSDEYTDKWGTFRSMFVPYKSASGQRYVIGADMDLSAVDSLEGQTTIRHLATGLVLLAIGAAVALLAARVLADPLVRVAAQVSGAVEQRDLSTGVSALEGAELERLSNSLNRFFSLVRETFFTMQTSVEENARLSAQLEGTACQWRQQLDVSASRLGGLARSAIDIQGNTQQAAALVQGAEADMAAAAGVLKRTQDVLASVAEGVVRSAADGDRLASELNALSVQAKSITEVLAVIRQVSEQTNLLALNAAIEAARAGDHGRGFAVVADEVRKLAGQTNATVEQTNAIVDTLVAAVRRAVEQMEESGRSNRALADSSQSVNQTVGELSGILEHMFSAVRVSIQASGQCRDAVDGMVNELDSLNRALAQNVQESHKVSEVADRLDEQTRELNARLVSFKT